MVLLQVHQYVGLILFVTALAAIVLAGARRVVVYVLLVQIVLGAAVWYHTKLVPPAAHWILAILTGGLWPMANAFAKRGRPKAVVMTVSALAALIIAYVIYLGMHALKGQTPLS